MHNETYRVYLAVEWRSCCREACPWPKMLQLVLIQSFCWTCSRLLQAKNTATHGLRSSNETTKNCRSIVHPRLQRLHPDCCCGDCCGPNLWTPWYSWYSYLLSLPSFSIKCMLGAHHSCCARLQLLALFGAQSRHECGVAIHVGGLWSIAILVVSVGPHFVPRCLTTQFQNTFRRTQRCALDDTKSWCLTTTEQTVRHCQRTR